jgi:16S rRNA (uracil1498-N3)-methyltransferase
VVPHARIIEPELSGTLEKENRHRIERVLRLREGDKFVITDGNGHEATVVLKKNGEYEGDKWESPNREPVLEVTLFAAVSKGDRLEWLIEKAVEMGVRRIVPLICERCVVKFAGNNKTERWQKIAATAMLQCGGCVLPKIESPVKVSELGAVFGKVNDDILPILLHEENLEISLKTLPETSARHKSVWLASGPEGGFSENEVNLFIKMGWNTVWLGKRLFKTDTAPTVALSVILSPHWF